MTRRPIARHIAAAAAATLMAAISVVACGSDGSDSSGGPVTVTLVAYDSFPKEGTALNDALAAFTKDTAITVNVVTAGDTGTMVSKAVLTASAVVSGAAVTVRIPPVP